jgi:hypothetical protein
MKNEQHSMVGRGAEEGAKGFGDAKTKELYGDGVEAWGNLGYGWCRSAKEGSLVG